MRRKYVMMLLYLVAQTIQAQTVASWSRKANLPTMTREFAIAFSIDSFGYLGCFGWHISDTFPHTPYYYNDLWQYNPYTDTWLKKADFPLSHKFEGVYFTIDHKAYIGMSDDGGGGNDMWEYDPAIDVWTRKADFPNGMRRGAIGFSIGGKGYVGMGISDTAPQIYMKDIWEFDPVANTWTQKADFVGPYMPYALSQSIAGKGYIGNCTGTYAPDQLTQNYLFQYDPVADTWTRKTGLPGLNRYSVVDFTLSGQLYVGCGTDTTFHHHKDFWRYDPQTDSWTQVDSFPGGYRIIAPTFTIGNKAYVCSGLDADLATQYNDTWEYTPDSIYRAGIREIDPSQLIRLYPNPNNGNFTLQTSQQIGAEYQIYDMLGQIAQQHYITSDTQSIDMGSATPGVYTLAIKGRNGSVRFTIMR